MASVWGLQHGARGAFASPFDFLTLSYPRRRQTGALIKKKRGATVYLSGFSVVVLPPGDRSGFQRCSFRRWSVLFRSCFSNLRKLTFFRSIYVKCFVDESRSVLSVLWSSYKGEQLVSCFVLYFLGYPGCTALLQHHIGDTTVSIAWQHPWNHEKDQSNLKPESFGSFLHVFSGDIIDETKWKLHVLKVFDRF